MTGRKATCLKAFRNGNLMRYFGIAVIISLSLLFIKGFTYAIPVYSPKVSNTQRSIINRTFTCGGKSTDLDYTVNVQCRPCTNLEMKLKDACRNTGNIEIVQCKSKEIYSLSCPFAHAAETQKFWVFQGCVFGISVLSNGVVWWRRYSLNSFMYQRLKRQISDAGV